MPRVSPRRSSREVLHGYGKTCGTPLMAAAAFQPPDKRTNEQTDQTTRWTSLCGVGFTMSAFSFNTLESRGNYCATSNNIKLVHWPLMGGLLASVPITVLLYNGPLLCGFNVGIKGLNPLKRYCIYTLGKLFTPHCLCHQAV